MFLGKQFKYLKENEIAGEATINPIIDWLRNLRSVSDFITLNPAPNGGMAVGLDVDSLARVIGRSTSETIIKHSFKITVDDDKFDCTGGYVFFGKHYKTISGLSNKSCASNKTLYVRLTKSGSTITGELKWDANMNNRIVASDGTVDLYIASFSKVNKEWTPTYHHFGDFFFDEYPAVWWDGYDASKTQFASHDSNGDMIWVDSDECES